MNVKVQLVPLGNKIKATIYGQPYCTLENRNFPKTFIFDVRNGKMNVSRIVFIFGSMKKARKFAGGSKTITKVVDAVNVFDFDPCDIIK